MHIVDERAACTACHDPHGIDGSLGNATNNSHLINFDTRVVSPNSRGIRRFTDRGTSRGACSLKCHGKDHDEESY